MTFRQAFGRVLRPLVLLCLAAPAVQAQVTLKIATLVPENSSWFRIVKEMGDTWNKVSGGKVRVILYPGGRQGDEPDVVRKMRLGSLQGAVLANPGLSEIDRSVNALSVPLAFDSDEEVYATLDRVRPELEGNMNAKGFVVLNWADGGWVRIFARRPVASPDDLRRQKLFTWAGDSQMVEVWRAGGFNVIPAPAPDLGTGLQTGLLDAFITSPQVAIVTRTYEQAPNMTDRKWAIIMTATVLTKDAWNRIPAEVRPALLKAAQDTALRLREEMRSSDQRDIQAMRQAGLKLVPLDNRNLDLWRRMIEGITPKVRGLYAPARMYDEVMRVRDEHRRQTRGKGK